MATKHAHSSTICMDTGHCPTACAPCCNDNFQCSIRGGNNWQCGNGLYQFERTWSGEFTIAADTQINVNPQQLPESLTGGTLSMGTLKKIVVVNKTTTATRGATVVIEDATNFRGRASVGNGVFITEDGNDGWTQAPFTITNQSTDHEARVEVLILGLA